MHLDIDAVRMVALSTLHTCYQLAFFTNTIAATAQTHVLLQREVITCRTQHSRKCMVIIFTILILAAIALQVHQNQHVTVLLADKDCKQVNGYEGHQFMLPTLLQGPRVDRMSILYR